MKPTDANEIVAVLALGADGAGARLLSRVTRKSWEELCLAEGASVCAQVKALAPGLGDLGGEVRPSPLVQEDFEAFEGP